MLDMRRKRLKYCKKLNEAEKVCFKNFLKEYRVVKELKHKGITGLLPGFNRLSKFISYDSGGIYGIMDHVKLFEMSDGNRIMTVQPYMNSFSESDLGAFSQNCKYMGLESVERKELSWHNLHKTTLLIIKVVSPKLLETIIQARICKHNDKDMTISYKDML